MLNFSHSCFILFYIKENQVILLQENILEIDFFLLSLSTFLCAWTPYIIFKKYMQ